MTPYEIFRPTSELCTSGLVRLFLLLLAFVSGLVVGFNVDPFSATVLSASGESASWREPYYGHSVAFLKSKGRVWVMIGAPRENTSRSAPLEPGMLHSCLLGRSAPSCSNVAVDTPSSVPSTDVNERRDEGWLGGVTVVHYGEQGTRLLTCASRWINHYLPEDDYFMNGACYWAYAEELLRDNTFINPMHQTLPLIELEKQRVTVPGTTQYKYYYQYGQAGFSATFMQRSGDVIMGAPGLDSWSGGIVRGKEGAATTHGHGLLRTTVYTSLGGVQVDDYLGYSVTAGVFWGTQELVAAAAPRSRDRGRVVLIKLSSSGDSASALQTLDGPALYGGFGWTLLGADTDGDSLDELFVGAPLMEDEAGVVLVYSSTGVRQQLNERKRLRPDVLRGRFGAALASLGDVDRDGYNDVVVGSPLEDGGSGAVYVFRGGVGGVSKTPSQRISAAAVSRKLAGFGGALATGMDIDDDGYSDVAIGSSYSDHAVVLRSRRVVSLNVSVQVEPSTLTREGELFVVTVCAVYAGHGAPTTAEATLTVRLDSKQPLPFARAVFTETNVPVTAAKVSLVAEEFRCSEYMSNLKASVSDVTELLTVLVTVASDQVVPDVNSRQCRSCPVLSPTSATSAMKEVLVALGCGEDHLCSPQLKLTPRLVRTDSPYVIGSGRDVFLEVKLTVEKEWAYQANLIVSCPPDVTVRSAPVSCSLEHPDEGAAVADQRPVITCRLPSPLKPGEDVVTSLSLQVAETLPATTQELIFTFNASAHDSRVSDQLTLKLQRDVSLVMFGHANPDRVYYGGLETTATVPLLYEMQVQNTGVTVAKTVLVKAWLPGKIQGKTLFTSIQVQNDNPFEEPRVCSTVGPKSQKSGDPGKVDGILQCEERKEECMEVTCMLSELGTGRITLETVINTSVIEASFGHEAVVSVTLHGTAEWTDGSGDGSSTTVSVSSIVVPRGFQGETEAAVPWWLYLVSTLAGVLLLAGITLLLYKCGFFKRKRPPRPTDRSGETGTETTSFAAGEDDSPSEQAESYTED